MTTVDLYREGPLPGMIYEGRVEMPTPMWPSPWKPLIRGRRTPRKLKKRLSRSNHGVTTWTIRWLPGETWIHAPQDDGSVKATRVR